MKANSIEWRKMCDRLFYGVALDEAQWSRATAELCAYLRNCNLRPLWEFLELKVVEHFRGEKVISRRICFRDSGAPLTVREIESIGCFMPGNPWYRPEYEILFVEGN